MVCALRRLACLPVTGGHSFFSLRSQAILAKKAGDGSQTGSLQDDLLELAMFAGVVLKEHQS